MTTLTAATIIIAGIAACHDGDTCRIGDVTIKLKDIDAPELRQVCQDERDNDYACGWRAAIKLEDLIGDKTVTCEIRGRDQYRRALGTCYIEALNVNAWLVANGWAMAYIGKEYLPQQAYARGHRLGVWAGWFELPSEWRRRKR